MSNGTATRPRILDNVDALDMFATTSTDLEASKLREGMVLLDPVLGTPLAWLDSRARSTRNSGNVKFLAHNLETGRLFDVQLHEHAVVSVLA